MAVSQLPREEVARRIKAARELRQISQTKLADLMAADGIGKHDLGQIERATRTMQRVHQDAILRHLGLPERWLTVESVDEVVGAAISDAQLAEILGPQLLAAVRGGLASPALGTPGQDDQDHPGESEEGRGG